MIGLGLTGAQRRILIKTLLNHHAQRIRVVAMSLDEEITADLSDRVLDGQVTVDGTADVTRTASLTLLDPSRSMDFDSNAPNEVAMFLNRMIKIWWRVHVDYGHGYQWEDIPVFTGPITSMSRNGPEVSVEAQGKESLCMGAVWKNLTLRKGRTKVSAIRIILRERAGESRFHFPGFKSTLPKDLSLNRHDVPWRAARSLARTMDWQLFYDGDGECQLRRHSDRTVLSFNPETTLSPLNASYSQDETVNVVFVHGGIPKNGKVQIAAEVFPPRRHPLSPWNLGRHNSQNELVPRYLMDTIEDNHIRSGNEARRTARRRLNQGLTQGVDATVDVLPIPLLEPGDMVRVDTDDGTITFRANTFSLSLTAGDPMTLGYVRNMRTGRLGGFRNLKLRTRTPEWASEMARYKAQQKKRWHERQQREIEHLQQQAQQHARQVAGTHRHTTHRSTRHRSSP